MKELPYKHGFSPIPWPLLDILSANAYKAFGKIAQCVFMNGGDWNRGVQIPTAILKNAVSDNSKTFKSAIDELEIVGVIAISHQNRKAISYSINWAEINIIYNYVKGLNFAGKNALRELINTKKVPISQIPEDDVERITQNTLFRTDGPESPTFRTNGIESPTFETNGTECDDVQDKWSRTDKIDAMQGNSERVSKDGFRTNGTEHSGPMVLKNAGFRTNGPTDNNTYNNNKKISEARSDSYIRGEKESYEQVEEAESSSDILQPIELNNPSDILEYKEKSYRKVPANPYSRKPYFAREILEEFASNPELCLNSPVKMFIYQFFWELSEYCYDIKEKYRESEAYDEDEEENTQESSERKTDFQELQNTSYPVDKVEKMMNRAYAMTCAIAEEGYYTEGDDSFPVTFNKDNTQFNFFFVCDGQLTYTRKTMRFSTAAFRNIEEADMEDNSQTKQQDSQKKIREGARNRQYAAFLMTGDKSAMTSVEKLQSEFLTAYITYDEFYHVEGCKNDQGDLLQTGSTLPPYVSNHFISRLWNAQIEPAKFFGSLAMAETWNKGMEIKADKGVFSYFKSQQLNQQLGMQSQATIEVLDASLSIDR